MELPRNYEIIQQKYTSNSRGTRMGRRVSQNVTECVSYLSPPLVCIGCGDGWEIEVLLKHFGSSIEDNQRTKQIVGVEVTKERVQTALSNNLPVFEGAAENIIEILGETRYNIYCAHTLEHCFNREVVIECFKRVALDTVVIIVPIELGGRTRNRAHYHPIANLGYIANLFGMDWKIVNLSYRWHIELEGLLILKRDSMNWPRKIRDQAPSSELLIRGEFK